ncbi:MAG: glutathione S-transferase N-terminal domain-containing protein [Chloroflexi bacterium]|nr:glutathione S-transferase N-terminal domain-containing protein [Chloroflexota bacterium]
MYSASWCPDCRRAKRFLTQHGFPFVEIDIEEDPTAARYVLEVNGGRRIIPTLVFEDGSVLVEPSNAALARKLGIEP